MCGDRAHQLVELVELSLAEFLRPPWDGPRLQRLGPALAVRDPPAIDRRAIQTQRVRDLFGMHSVVFHLLDRTPAHLLERVVTELTSIIAPHIPRTARPRTTVELLTTPLVKNGVSLFIGLSIVGEFVSNIPSDARHGWCGMSLPTTRSAPAPTRARHRPPKK